MSTDGNRLWASSNSGRPFPEEVEVAVVGAGPTGLMLAALLCAYGIRTAVLDRATGPAGQSRAAVIQARTLETLEPLGVASEILGRGVVVPHFGIRDRDRRLLAVDFGLLPTAHPYTVMLQQEQTESVLRKALHRNGGEVQWGCEVTDVRQTREGVELQVETAETDGTVRARFAAGCDGANGSVREALRIPFEGGTYPQSFVLADVRMEWGLPEGEVQLFFSPEGLVVVAPLPQNQYRVVATVDEAPQEPTLEHVRALLHARGPRTPKPRVEEIVWSSRFSVHHKIAASFRQGGVFLCGDACHIHSPAGGQGMNTGIQDAANIAWKLALVLRGYAGSSAAARLLDSYERERRPVAQEVVSATHRLTRLATMRSPVGRRIRNLLISGAGRSGPLPRRLARNLAQIDVAYRDGWCVSGSGAVERWASKAGAPTLSPDPTLALVVPEDYEREAMAGAKRFSDLPVRVAPATGVDMATLVRPDGYVAGRSAPDEHKHLVGLLARSLGAAKR